jgi:hypothetical protein
MALPTVRPLNRVYLNEYTTSIATTPVAMYFVVPVSGYLREVIGATAGTTTGTITLAVAQNGGSDLTSGGLTIAAGSGYTPSTYVFPMSGANAVFVNSGDVITVTPSGGTGSSIPGAVTVVMVANT